MTTEELPQPQQEQQTSDEEERRPYYTYTSHELCSEILSDIQDLGDKAHNAKNLWDMALLWYDLEHKNTLMLTKIKLELLQHILEQSQE